MSYCCFLPAPGPGHRRYYVAWMTCLGLMLVLVMRCELGIAMIKLTEQQSVTGSKLLPNSSNSHTVRARIVKWSDWKIGMIESAFFIGYCLFSIPGGILSTFVPSHLVLGVAVAITCALNLLIPLFVSLAHSFKPIFILRVLQGAAEGCLYPSVLAIWSLWAPIPERSKLVTISFFGMALGPIVGFPLTGYLLGSSEKWQIPFYLYGCVGLAWAVVWLITVRSSPRDDPCITPEELTYIEAFNRKDTPKGMLDVPWWSIVKSTPVWAIVFANAGRNWLYQFSMSGLPKYFDDVFNEREETIGLHMMLPYVLMAVFTPIAGTLADLLYRRSGLSLGWVRKIFNTVGFTVSCGGLLTLAWSKAILLSTISLSVALGFIGVGLSGFGVNHLDIAPQYAGLLMGISNGIGTVSGIVSPIVAMRMTSNHSFEEWRNFFAVSASFIAMCALMFLIFGSGDVQSWAVRNEEHSVPFVAMEGKGGAAYGSLLDDHNADGGDHVDLSDKKRILE